MKDKDVVIFTEKTIRLNDFEKHIILYAKHHYERIDIFNDIKKIRAYISGIDVEYISDMDVFQGILKTAWPWIKCDSLFECMRRAICWSSKNVFKFDILKEDKIPIYNLVEWLLGELSIIQIYQDNVVLVDIGEPDYGILPEPKKELSTSRFPDE